MDEQPADVDGTEPTVGNGHVNEEGNADGEGPADAIEHGRETGIQE
jgi:hypothetical protein